MLMQKSIVVTLRIEGTHNWPECPLEEVSFLKHPHRHEFHIKVKKIVQHNDRDLEIIMFKRMMQSYFTAKWGKPAKFGRMSCEDIAEHLMDKFDLQSCEVLEDGENGAFLCL